LTLHTLNQNKRSKSCFCGFCKSLGLEFVELFLARVPSEGFGFSLFFEAGNDVLVLPSDFVTESAKDGEWSLWFEFEDSEGRWDNNSLEFIIRRRDTFK